MTKPTKPTPKPTPMDRAPVAPSRPMPYLDPNLVGLNHIAAGTCITCGNPAEFKKACPVCGTVHGA